LNIYQWKKVEMSSEDIAPTYTRCLVCRAKNFKVRLRHHLLFGTAACQDCDWLATTCSTFAARNTCTLGCIHVNLKWSFPQLSSFETGYRDEHVKMYLDKYLKVTRSLRNCSPWKVGFAHFVERLTNLQFDDKDSKAIKNDITRIATPSKLQIDFQNLASKTEPIVKEEGPITEIGTPNVELSNVNNSSPEDCKPIIKVGTPNVELSNINNSSSDCSFVNITPSTTPIKQEPPSPPIVATPLFNDLIIDANSPDYDIEENIVPQQQPPKFVLTRHIRDFCTHCYEDLPSEWLSTDAPIGLFIVRCRKCLIYICYDVLPPKIRASRGLPIDTNGVTRRLDLR